MTIGVQNSTLKCPFCDKGSIKSILLPRSVKLVKTSWGGSKPGIRIKEEKYEVLEDCPHCHKSKKEIQKALTEGVTKPKSKEELKKQLEELGLSGKL